MAARQNLLLGDMVEWLDPELFTLWEQPKTFLPSHVAPNWGMEGMQSDFDKDPDWLTQEFIDAILEWLGPNQLKEPQQEELKYQPDWIGF